jgi:alpha-ketoglutarate-dependent taurine dioxygenase
MFPTFIKDISYSTSKDFPEQLKKLIKETKVVHLKGLPEGIDYKEFYSDLVLQLGEIVGIGEDALTGNATHEQWTDIRYDKSKEHTFRHSNTRQPLHTDAAYASFDLDVNFFFCLENAEIGGATTFVDADSIIYILSKYEPELYERIQKTEIKFGKGQDQRKTRKIIYKDGSVFKLNWNYYRVSPENTDEAKVLCEDFHNFLETRIVAAGLQTPVALKVGDGLFFHDTTILHGRNSFYGDRCLIKGGFNFN